jgi:two-component system cell cycle sensor histidine kinase/response regulator CckA
MSSRSLPPHAQHYLYAALGGATISALFALATVRPERNDLVAFAVLAVCAGAAQLFIVRTGQSHGFHTALALVVAASLLLPPGLIVLLVVAQHVPEWIKERYPWYIQTFNIANYTLNGLCASAVATAVAGSVAGPAGFALAGAAAAVTFVVMNHMLLGTMLRLARRRSLRESELLSARSLATDFVIAGLGVAIAYLWLKNPWLLPVVAAPLLLSHRSYSLLAELRTSEERFRTIFEHAGFGIGLVGLDGRLITGNPALAKMLGYGRDELAGLALGDYAHPDHAADEQTLVEETIAGERDQYSFETRYLAKSGATVWANVSASLVRDVGSRPRFVIAMVEDVTARKAAQEAVREGEERYRELFENANDVVFTVDQQARFTGVNAAAERLTGYSAEELVGASIADLFTLECRELAMGQLASKIVGQPAATHEWTICTRDGREVAMEVACAPVRARGRVVGVQGIARDLSERKELEQQLRQAQKMEAIGRLAGGIAHDFNNLMTAITGYSELALQRLEDAPDPHRRDLEEIQKAADRATRLTRQLLAFSRKQVLQPVRIDLNEVVHDMEKMLGRVIGDDVEIRTKFDSDLGGIEADRSQLEQVLLNLAVNARDAMPDGGMLTIETTNVDVDGYSVADPGVVPAGQYVCLTVADTGTGMDEPTRARLFEPFFTTKDVGKGTGLGLATVYGIVKQSGGFVTVESEPDQGAVFRIYLNRLAPQARPAERVRSTVAPAGSETILLVEDDDAVREIAVGILERNGYRVLAACDGVEALRKLNESGEEVDLLLTDVVMPRLNGSLLAERLVTERPPLKVLFMSGYADEAIESDGTIRLGTDFIQKPFTAAILAAKVREVLDSRPTTLVA